MLKKFDHVLLAQSAILHPPPIITMALKIKNKNLKKKHHIFFAKVVYCVWSSTEISALCESMDFLLKPVELL